MRCGILPPAWLISKRQLTFIKGDIHVLYMSSWTSSPSLISTDLWLQEPDHLCAKCAVKGSDRPPLCAGTRSSTPTRSHTSAWPVARPSTGAPPSTPTWGSTTGTSPGSVSSAGKASTRRETTRTTVWRTPGRRLINVTYATRHSTR